MLKKSGVMVYKIGGSSHAYKVLIDENIGENFIPDIVAGDNKLSILVKGKDDIFGIRYNFAKDYSIEINDMGKFKEDGRVSFDSFLQSGTVSYEFKEIFAVPEKVQKYILVIRRERLESMFVMILLFVLVALITEFHLMKDEKRKEVVEFQHTIARSAMGTERHKNVDFSRLTDVDGQSRFSVVRDGKKARIRMRKREGEVKKGSLFRSVAIR